MSEFPSLEQLDQQMANVRKICGLDEYPTSSDDPLEDALLEARRMSIEHKHDPGAPRGLKNVNASIARYLREALAKRGLKLTAVDDDPV